MYLIHESDYPRRKFMTDVLFLLNTNTVIVFFTLYTKLLQRHIPLWPIPVYQEIIERTLLIDIYPKLLELIGQFVYRR